MAPSSARRPRVGGAALATSAARSFFAFVAEMETSQPLTRTEAQRLAKLWALEPKRPEVGGRQDFGGGAWTTSDGVRVTNVDLRVLSGRPSFLVFELGGRCVTQAEASAALGPLRPNLPPHGLRPGEFAGWVKRPWGEIAVEFRAGAEAGASSCATTLSMHPDGL